MWEIETVLGGCPKVLNYWKDVNKVNQLTFKTLIPGDFNIMYLGYKPPQLKGTDENLCDVLLASGKKRKTKRRTVQREPTVREWNERRPWLFSLTSLWDQ